jgi:hypothetical protein
MISVVIFLCSRVLVAKCWDVLVIVPCYLLNGTPFAKKKDQGLISLSLSLSLSPSPLASSLVRLTFSPFSAHIWILESNRPPDLLSLSLSPSPVPSWSGVKIRLSHGKRPRPAFLHLLFLVVPPSQIRVFSSLSPPLFVRCVANPVDLVRSFVVVFTAPLRSEATDTAAACRTCRPVNARSRRSKPATAPADPGSSCLLLRPPLVRFR